MIDIKRLTKTYNLNRPNEVNALADLNLQLEEGEIMALTGPSGCGKTTLLSIISLLLTPTSGEIRFSGEDVLRNSDNWKTRFRRDQFGFIFQHINLLPQYSALENVLLPLYSFDTDPLNHKEHAIELFDMLGISERINSQAEQLSGGEQQRVACIRALIKQPNYLFADEPTVFVDEESSRMIEEIFQELRANGKTIILSTHDQNLLKIADRVIRLCKGKVV